MADNSQVRAPYNFIPFSNKILVYPYDAPPAHDKLDPALKTGEIHVTMTAETPVFVSDGHKNGKGGPEPHFFRAPNGRYALPGSTVRGMVRANMQILGFGVVRPDEDIKDYQIYYRDMTAAKGTAGEPLKEYYRSVLDIVTRRTPDGKAYTIPQNVRAGYLAKDGERYVIRPVRGTYLRVSRKNPGMAALGSEPARTVPVAYTEAEGAVKSICPAAKSAPGMRRGTLLFTGRPVGSKPNHLYVFPEADAEAPEEEISREDVISYSEDFENRKNSLGPQKNFWKLPEGQEEKPVFYIRHNGHIYFGMSLFLRVGYQHALSEGLPQNHRDKADAGVLDYPRAILGFAGEDCSYRSRVSFGDLSAVGDPREMARADMILGQPKPSYYPGYVSEGRSYAEEEFRLRGYKQYWLKEAGAPAPESGREKVSSSLRPLPAGTRFRGVIRYKNLREEELGLLLWSLRLEEGCFQSVGMGKPYGYGRMKLIIDELRELDAGALYSYDGLTASLTPAPAEAVARSIDCYDAFAAKALHVKKGGTLRSLEEIQDFFYVRGTIRDPGEVGYMELSAYKNIRSPLPTAALLRKEAVQAPEKPPEDPYAALKAKFKKL